MKVANWLLDIVAHFNPEYAPVIDWVEKNPDKVHKLVVVGEAAIKDGRKVVDDVQRDAPDLIKAIRELVDASQAPQSNAQLEKHVENSTRMAIGLPRMTPQEEQRWFSAAGAAGNSQAGSG
jgi:hypothetical protein